MSVDINIRNCRAPGVYFPLRTCLLVSLAVFPGGCTPSSGQFGGHYNAGTRFWDKTPVIRHTFPITNTTSRAIHIISKHASCTCTTSELGKWTLGPGESTTLKIEIKTPRQTADLKIPCSLITDYIPNPQWNYVIAYKTYGRISCDPSVLALSENDTEKDFYCDVYFEQAEQLPQPTVTAPSEISVDLGRQPVIEKFDGGAKRARYPVHISVTRNRESVEGRFERSVSFSIPNDHAASALLVWEEHKPFRASPSMISFGNCTRHATKEVQILVNSSTNRAFKIVEYKMTGDLGTIEVAGDIGKTGAQAESHRLTVRFGVPKKFSRVTAMGTLRLITDQDDQREILVPWSAIVRDEVLSKRVSGNGSDTLKELPQ